MKPLLLFLLSAIPLLSFTCSKRVETLSYTSEAPARVAASTCDSLVFRENFETAGTDWTSTAIRRPLPSGGVDTDISALSGQFYLSQSTFDTAHAFTFQSNRAVTLGPGMNSIFSYITYRASFGGYSYRAVNLRVMLVNPTDTLLLIDSRANTNFQHVITAKSKHWRSFTYRSEFREGTYKILVIATTPAPSAFIDVDDIGIQTFCSF